MKVVIIAAMDRNGVIGRTTKPHAFCDGTGIKVVDGERWTCPSCNKGRVLANDLPWGRAYPEDMAHFKAVTSGHAVIMFRRTWESLPKSMRPLPGRLNIVVSRTATMKSLGSDDVLLTPKFDRAFELADALGYTTAFVIGGRDAFVEALPIACELELTLIDREFDGDIRFPLRDAPTASTDRIRGTLVHGGVWDMDFDYECVERRPGENPELTFTTWRRRR